MAKANQLEELSDQERQAVLLGADALKQHDDFNRKSFDRWATIAKGVAPLCDLAARRGMARKARVHLLKDNGYGSLNPSTVSRLLHMAKLETAIRVWRDTLTPNKRDSWNSPTSICDRCPAVKKAIAEANKDRPPRTSRKVDRVLTIERALDTISDYANSLTDADQRAVLVERLRAATRPGENKPACSFCGLPANQAKLLLTPQPPHDNSIGICAKCITLANAQVEKAYAEAKAKADKEMAALDEPARERESKHKKTKTAPVKRAAKATSTLIWKQEEGNSLVDGGHYGWEAPAAHGWRYLVKPSISFSSLKFAGYSVYRWRKGEGALGSEHRLAHGISTAEQAKAIAETHHKQATQKDQ